MTRNRLPESVDSPSVSSEGDRVRARRERLGYDKKRLAAEAGVSRETLYAIERGESFRASSLAKIERVLTEAEHEAGIDAPPPPRTNDRISFDVSGEGGFRVVVEGPTADADLLRHQVTEIIREIRRDNSRKDSE